jgi:uncharacterized protein YkwD
VILLILTFDISSITISGPTRRSLVMMRGLFAVLISFGLVASCKAQVQSVTPVASVNKNLILELVNKARQQGCKCGGTYYSPAPLLEWNEALEKAAMAHSKDMDKKRYFSHIAPDGSNTGDRMLKAGYRWKTYGENIGEGFNDEKEIVAGWLSSPGHCKNIMNKSFREMGVGLAGGKWTQVFGSR